jgi:hypothetical protein
VTSVTKARIQKLAKKLKRLSKPTDMTIHWKALEKHFLMVKTSVLKGLIDVCGEQI